MVVTGYEDHLSAEDTWSITIFPVMVHHDINSAIARSTLFSGCLQGEILFVLENWVPAIAPEHLFQLVKYVCTVPFCAIAHFTPVPATLTWMHFSALHPVMFTVQVSARDMCPITGFPLLVHHDTNSANPSQIAPAQWMSPVRVISCPESISCNLSFFAAGALTSSVACAVGAHIMPFSPVLPWMNAHLLWLLCIVPCCVFAICAHVQIFTFHVVSLPSKPPRATGCTFVAMLRQTTLWPDETCKRGFNSSKLQSMNRRLDNAIHKMRIGCYRGRYAKPTESIGAYNFIYTNLPTCKSDRCQFYFNKTLTQKHVFVKQEGGCLWTHRKHTFIDRG